MKKAVPHVAASPSVLIFPDDLVQRWRQSSLTRILDERIWQCKVSSAQRPSRQPKQDQGERGGCRLDEQNPPAHAQGAINPGNNHAKQEEHLDLEGKIWNRLDQSPDQSGGEKAIIEPLIGGEHGGIGRLLR